MKAIPRLPLLLALTLSLSCRADWLHPTVEEALASARRQPGNPRLSFERIRLTNLPPEVCEITNLVELNLSGCGLKTLPPELARLTKLQTLNLSGNRFEELPAVVLELKKLNRLDLKSSPIRQLPMDIDRLENLRDLTLTGTRLRQIPEQIGKLKQLRYFEMRGGETKGLPKSICALTNLMRLDICCQQISHIPEEIGQLTRLGSLDLSCNQLAQFPSSISNLTQLHHFRLDENPMTEAERARVIGLLAEVEYRPLLNEIRMQRLADNPDADRRKLNQFSVMLHDLRWHQRREQDRLLKEWKEAGKAGSPPRVFIELKEQAPETVANFQEIFSDAAYSEVQDKAFRIVGDLRPVEAVKPLVPSIAAALQGQHSAGAAYALGELGGEAAPAVPDLIKVVRKLGGDNTSYPGGLYMSDIAASIMALGRMGPAAKECAPLLKQVAIAEYRNHEKIPGPKTGRSRITAVGFAAAMALERIDPSTEKAGTKRLGKLKGGCWDAVVGRVNRESPAPGTRVYLWREGRVYQAQADDKGQFQIELPEGHYLVITGGSDQDMLRAGRMHLDTPFDNASLVTVREGKTSEVNLATSITYTD